MIGGIVIPCVTGLVSSDSCDDDDDDVSDDDVCIGVDVVSVVDEIDVDGVGVGVVDECCCGGGGGGGI